MRWKSGLLLFFGLALLLPAQGLPTASPEEVGLSSERLARIDKVIQEYIDRGQLPGAVVLVARRGRAAWFKSFGFTDAGRARALRTDAIFRIGSMSKPLAAAAAMILLEEGRVLLDDPVARYIPEFLNPRVLVDGTEADGSPKTEPAKSPVRVRHLLTHTSGLGYGVFEPRLRPIYRKAGISDGCQALDTTLGEKMKVLARLPLAFHPGEKVMYGLSPDVLGYLVEVVSGRSYDEFLRERIFAPLRMQDTSFFLTAEKQERLMPLFEFDPGKGLRPYGPGIVERDHLVFSPTFPVDRPRTYFSPGSALVSTAADYARFGQMLLDGGKLDGVRVLSRKTVEMMTADQEFGVVTDVTNPYRSGFLLFVQNRPGRKNFGHGGLFLTTFLADPEEDLLGILMSQVYPGPGMDLLDKFESLIYQSIDD